jgi:tRNA pseudouridine32 synthase/23S rRNA pseudouridine746 synthase/23S rRNA pseudouridine1911/1915/1917 synthase
VPSQHSPWLKRTVPDHAAGWTLEEFLRQEMGVSGRLIQRLTRIRGIRWNREETFLGRKVRAGDEVAVKLKPRGAAAPRAVKERVPVLWKDSRALVVAKPAGMASHAEGPRSGTTLVDVLRAQLARPERNAGVHLVHRLDRPTSGALLVARDALAHAQLDQLLRDGAIERSYLARVVGVIAEDELVIDAPIGRDETHATRRKVDAAGQPAQTRLRVLARDEQTTLVQLWPVTGRTHQLRVHLAHLGHPILGDRLYGGSEHARLLLHAWKLSFALPWKDGERVEVSAEPPAELVPPAP